MPEPKEQPQHQNEVYGALTALGERLYLEALCLCDSEKDAAAWASATLVRSLEERGLLGRLNRAE